jgi:hypothetical protein
MLKVGKKMKEQTIEQSARSALQECLEKVPFLQFEAIESSNLETGIDLQATVRVQDRTIRLLAGVKRNGQPRLARQAVYEIKHWLTNRSDSYGIFIAPYISARAGAICEEAGIGYLDLAGNCLLSFGTVYIRQAGAPNPKIQKRDLRSLYSPKAERILRALLDEPQRAWKLTELAQAVGVSLGQVANVKKLLLDREWVSTLADGLHLISPNALLDEWTPAYNFRRNEMQDYYALAEIPEIEAQLAEICPRLDMRYALTGFSSAARLAPMVRYQKASAYVKGDVSSLIEALEWKAVTSGANISLLIPYDDGVFYGAKIVDDITITAPVQTYLDLQSYRGRGQEAAQAVRKELEKAW